MISLIRHLDESVMLYTSDGLIEVKVYAIQHGRITLSIDAPQAVKILRKELGVLKDIGR